MGFGALYGAIQCEVEAANQTADCLATLEMCDPEAFGACVEGVNFRSCFADEALSQLQEQCLTDTSIYVCSDGEEIPSERRCDGNGDCFCGEDEVDGCPPPFTCEDGSSIPAAWLCDGTSDCEGGEDELPERCPMSGEG